MSEDIYFVPVVLWILTSALETINYPTLPERFIGFPSVFLNNIPLILLFFCFVISRKFRKSERSFTFLYLGFVWSVFLLSLYKMGGLLEDKLYSGYMYSHFHINLTSILSLHYYYLVFFLLLYLEGKFKILFLKIDSLLDLVVKRFLKKSVLEIYEEMDDSDK